MLADTLGASLLGNQLAGKVRIRASAGATAASQGRKANISGQGIVRAGQDF